MRRGARLAVLLSWLLLPAAAAPALAQIGVSPPTFDLDLGPGPATETVRIFNYGDRPTAVEVGVHNFELDEINRVRLLPPTEQSLDQWIVINPLRFEIPPGGSQAVRFSVRPRVRPEAGEHRAMIYFSEVPDAFPPDPGSTAAVRAWFRIGVAVYANAGDVDRRGVIEELEVADGVLAYEVASTGSAHVRLRGGFKVWPAEAYPGGEQPTAEAGEPEPALTGRLPTTPVLPGATRSFRLPLEGELAPGDYILDLEARLGDQPVRQGVRFTVLSPSTLEAEAR